MKLAEKLPYARAHLDSVIDHGDASEAEVQAAVAELRKYIDDQWAKAKKRRADAAKAKALPQ